MDGPRVVKARGVWVRRQDFEATRSMNTDIYAIGMTIFEVSQRLSLPK